ncbi:MAG: DegQ family serine endoprotease [Desulfobulbaceae bacterium]|nr:DegQ family serine endoprotease [Desulfobulbaceae bacterium]HIJ78058.1 DegQ family serine endoprotease [Deltaproteobacteria bacterium]
MNPSITGKPHFLHRPLLLTLILTGLTFVMLTALAGAATPPNTFADLAEKFGPTVVNIYTTQVVKAPRSPQNFFFDDQEMPEMFRKFFKDQVPFHNNQQQPPREMKRTSLGSGVITSKDGYIITNNHVVENADTISVRLTSHDEYEAKIIGRDPKTDLALIKIEPKNGLPVVEFGNSEELRVGDWVMAIGNPFGFEQTVTAGIVSGKGRSLGSGPYENFIQTDASINPGNSGGPLFNMAGQMVGINTAIYSRSGGNIGIGFAIPINMAKNVIAQLKEHGTVVRGWLGVMIQQVTPELAAQFKLDRPIGALVGEVSPNSPAEKAGIKPGDVIIEFNGKEITQMSMLPNIVAQMPVGSKAKMVISRKGKNKDLTVIIAKLDEEQVAMQSPTSEFNEKIGLTVQNLTPELAQSLGIKAEHGVLIASVEPGSPAAEARMRKGDLILEVNQEPVKNVTEYNSVLKKAQQQNIISFFIKREGHTSFVALKIN